ncbi:hypothetical protein [Roseovarius tolerans]|uniref:hypothetical protein n=1 Tax=Roseovarius tolerans TaxID=74031 RepID=UPI000B0DBD27|nr:hypothetical protein [Roseovarius tolerans]
MRTHDLRHTYASNAVSSGMPIQMVGRLQLDHVRHQAIFIGAANWQTLIWAVVSAV